MSDESFYFLKYAINIGYDALKEALDTFESMNLKEKSKYRKMIEELAEELGVPPEEIADYY